VEPDQIVDSATQTATAEPPVEAAKEPTVPDATPSTEVYTAADLAALREELQATKAELQELSNRGYRSLQSVLDQQRAEVRLQNQRIQEILKLIAQQGSVTDDDLTRIDERLELELHRARQQQQQQAQQQAQRQLTPEEIERRTAELVTMEYHEQYKAELADMFAEEELEFGTDRNPSALRRQIEAIDVPIKRGGARDWAAWKREAKKLIKAAADEQVRASKAPARVPDSGNAGRAVSEDQEIVNRMARGEYLSPAEIARGQAAMSRGVYPR
jgi:hypothetical protein